MLPTNLLVRRPAKVAAVALANKTARRFSDGGGPKGRTLRKGIPARRALGNKKLADVSKYCTSSPAGQTACEEVVTLRGDGR